MAIELPGGRKLLLTGLNGGFDWFLLLSGIIALGLIVWLYREERRLVSRRSGVLLLVLRLMVAALFVCTLLGPVTSLEETKTIRGRVLIAADLSESMNSRDPGRSESAFPSLAKAIQGDPKTPIPQMSRLDIVQRWLSPDFTLIQQLQSDHDLIGLAFAREIVLESGIDRLSRFVEQPNNVVRDVTDWSPVLARALRVSEESPVLGVVLLTDGRNNGPGESGPLVDRLAARHVPIYPVLIGSTTPPNDVAIASLKAPDRVNVGDAAQISASIKADGLAPGTLISVTLSRPGTPPLRQNISVPADRSRPTVNFKIPLETLGNVAFSMAVNAPTSGFDTHPENDRREFNVQVVNDKSRVLIVSEMAGWEFRYLRNALVRDTRVTVDAVVFHQPSLAVAQGTSYLRKLPEIHEGADPLSRYDVIILLDVAEGDLAAKEWSRLEAFTTRRGGTLVLAPGPRFSADGLKSEATRNLAPVVEMRVVADTGAVDPRRSALLGGAAIQPLDRWLADPNGWPMLQLGEGTESSKIAWGDLPRLPWVLVGKAKPGATVLAEVRESEGASLSPVLVSQAFGLGKVLWVGADATWRWRFRVGDLYHHRFWGQTIRWAGSEKLAVGNKLVRHGPLKTRIAEGDSVGLQARLSEEIPGTLSNILMVARLYEQGPDGKPKGDARAVIPLRTAPGQSRVFEGTVPGLTRGLYRIRLESPQIQALPAATEAGPIPDALLEVRARETSERVELAASRELLDPLATATGGAVLLESEVNRLPELLRAHRQTSRVVTEISLWDQPILLVLVFAMITTEWVIRKRAGLI